MLQSIKKVEMPELFFDLVYVYAISQMTHVIHDVVHFSDLIQQLFFLVVLLVIFVNTWMFETVFTNRYGSNNLVDILFLMLDMSLLLFMSNSFSGEINHWLRPFMVTSALMTITLVTQYLIVFKKKKSAIDRKIARIFVIILLIRAIFFLIAAYSKTLSIGLTFMLTGVLMGWILPAFFSRTMAMRPINFSHLLERLTLLAIVVFGESIVEVASFFTVHTISIQSYLVFSMICGMFLMYITQFDHFINVSQNDPTGIYLIYLHYLVIFGITFVSVSIELIGKTGTDLMLTISSAFVGLFCFYLGIFMATKYNKESINLPSYFWIYVFSVTLVVFIISLFSRSATVFIILTASNIIFIEALYIFFLNRSRNFVVQNKDER
ncbi:low temperature requirement protein A [Leuconostoc sp. JNUCC 76]